MSRLTDPKLKYVISRAIVDQSLAFLQAQGRFGHEGVVLWPARLEDHACVVSEPIIPKQITGPLSYRIPNDETFRIVRQVSERGQVIPIQVHSHPREAFHSLVDDELAFVQHENAISIVVPNFGAVSSAQLRDGAKFYRLRPVNEWIEMTQAEVKDVIQFDAL